MVMANCLNAYIIAGGKSSRMGTDKGLLALRDKMLIEWVIDELRLIFKEITIVSNNAAYRQLGLEVMEDEIKGLGPAGGIYTALKHSSAEKFFVVSCDMPFITLPAIQYMVDHSAGMQITVPVYRQKVQPLFAVYTKSCLPVWTRLIHEKMIKLQEMLEYFNLCKLDVDAVAIFTDKMMMNINDKSDLEQGYNFLKNEN